MAAAKDAWYNLSEMSRLTGINRAQLHKYVKSDPAKFKTQKMGKRTVFAESCVKVFQGMREAGLKKVGKKVTPRPKAAGPVRRKPGRPKAAAAKKATPKKAAPKKAAKKTVKKAVKKAAKKTVKKAVKKAAPKKVAKRAVRKPRALGKTADLAQVVAAVNALKVAVAALQKDVAKPIVLSMQLKKK